jgi:predicted metal-dependent enzyme (double-stranded beta helix superfamily)
MIDVSPERLKRACSHECMEGQPMLFSNCCGRKLTSFISLQQRLNELFATKLQEEFLEKRRYDIQAILESVDLPCEEFLKYAKFSPQLELPYTRNLVYENEHYSILLLCWKPGAESKIHNHPCDGCLILPLRGSMVETVYEKQSTENIHDVVNEELKLVCEQEFQRGQVGFMSDGLGQYHKIGSKEGCISLHLYTPPFSKCKIWVQDHAKGKQSPYKSVEVSMKFFSVNGCVAPSDTLFTLDHYL